MNPMQFKIQIQSVEIILIEEEIFNEGEEKMPSNVIHCRRRRKKQLM